MNVGGIWLILELVMGADRLCCFNFFLIVFIFGDREGVIMEEDLVWLVRFRIEFEWTKFEVEVILWCVVVDFLIFVYCLLLIVGDSRMGEFDIRDDFYYVMLGYFWILVDMLVPFFGCGDYLLYFVFVDFVVCVMQCIFIDSRGVGQIFYFIDSNFLSVKWVMELISDYVERFCLRGAIFVVVVRCFLKLLGL